MQRSSTCICACCYLCYFLKYAFNTIILHCQVLLFFLCQLPELHQLMVEAAEILNIEPPDLYVRQSPVPNAYTLAISGKKPFVVVHTSLVELLTRKELQVISVLVTIISVVSLSHHIIIFNFKTGCFGS